MTKFRVELWRIIKFLLITAAVNLLFSLVNTGITTTLLANSASSTGMWLSVLSWGFTLGTTLVATLLHRCFTFRSTEPWYVAVSVMLIAAIVWTLVKSIPLNAAGNADAQMIITMTYLLSFIWMLLSYLLQHCVIYCHTTDTNGWYRRFHPTNDE